MTRLDALDVPRSLAHKAKEFVGFRTLNFIIDEYLRLIQVSCATNNSLVVETLPWELFERAVGSLPVHRLLKGRNPLLLQDVVLVPCNTPESEHWTLLAVLPKEKSVVVLDSIPSNHIKHTSLDAISKMCGLLKEINSSIDLNQWKLIVNKKGDVPEQTNDYDYYLLVFKTLGRQW